MHLGTHFARALRNRGDAVAIIDGKDRVTYGELATRANRLANALIRAGRRKGDRVALLMPNCKEALYIDGAIMSTGLIKVPLNARASPHEIKAMIQDSGASVLFTHEALHAVALEASQGCAALKEIYSVAPSAPHGAWGDFELLMSSGADDPVQADIAADDVYSLNYTSGTSGVLKAAMLTHGNWICLTRSFLLRRGMQPDRPRVNAYVAPITHAAGAAILSNLYAGAVNLLLRKFEPSDFLRVVEAYRVTDVLLVPTMINMLLECPDLPSYDLSSLENIVYGTAPMAPERIKQALKAFGPILTQGYGQTESSAIVSTLGREDHLAVDDPSIVHRLASAGQPAFEAEVRIVDDDGKDVPTGEIGEIAVRGPMVMKGYWNAPELTRETIKDGWLYTRDMGRMDADGYLYLVDRKSDMIITGGFNVYPAEVENVLYQHPDVFEAAVVSAPDSKWGESIKAVVVLKDGAKSGEADLIAFCRDRLAHFKAPGSVDFVSALPKSPVGKILRRIVREKYWQGMSRRVS